MEKPATVGDFLQESTKPLYLIYEDTTYILDRLFLETVAHLRTECADLTDVKPENAIPWQGKAMTNLLTRSMIG